MEAVEKLLEVKSLLAAELETTHSEDRSPRAELILRYLAGIELLIEFARERDFKAFCLVFPKYKITVEGVRECFDGPRKNKAGALFTRASLIILKEIN